MTSLRAIAYIRVSTDKQEHSVEAQRRRVIAQAQALDYDLVDVVIDEDEFSGNLNRPGMQRILEMVRAKSIDVVIATKLDRISRSTRDVIDLIELFERRGVALVSISESLDTKSPMGRFFVRMIANLAELEREVVGARTSEVLQDRKARGYPAGKAPYGWRNVGKTVPLEADPEEQRVLTLASALRAEGESFEYIAKILNANGYLTRSETPWLHQYVRRILIGIGKEGKCTE